MADKLGEAYVEVRGDTKKLGPDLAGVGSTIGNSFSKAASSVNGMLGSLASVAMQAAPWASLVGFIGAATREFGLATTAAKEQADADKKLEGVLRATGGAAGLTAEELKKHATEMQNSLGIADDEIQNFQAILLTFRNVQEDVFERATDLAADMAAVMGGDMSSKAVQLGKALNDPVKGIMALTRVGVAFDETQKKQIKRFAESGQIVEAQKIILAELAAEFGGAAAKMAEGPQGKLKLLGVQLAELREELGNKLVPFQMAAARAQMLFVDGLTKVAAVIGPVVEGLMAINDATGGFVPIFAAATIGLWQFTAAWPALKTAAMAAINGINMGLLASGWGAVIIAIGAAVAGLVVFVRWLSTLKPVQQAWNNLTEKLGQAWKNVQKAFMAIKPLLVQLFAFINPQLAELLKNWDGTWKMIEFVVGKTVKKIIDEIAKAIDNVAKWARVLAENWPKVFDLIVLGAAYAASRIGDVFRNLGMLIGDVLAVITKKVAEAVGVMNTAMGGVAKALRGDFAGAAAAAASATAGAARLGAGFGGELAAAGAGRPLTDEGPVSKALMDQIKKILGDLLMKRFALEKPDPAKPGDKRKKTGDLPDEKMRDVRGIFGPEELARKLQEAMLKDTKTDRIVDATEAGAAAGKEAVATLGRIEGALAKTAPIPIADV